MLYTNPPIPSSFPRGEPMDLDAPFAAMNPKMQQYTAFALHRTEFALPPLITLLEQHSEPSSPAEKTRTQTSFMDLPREIRLQIYGWVHRMTPFKQKQLASWYPVPKSGLYINRRVVVPPETNGDANDNNREGEEDISMPDAVQVPEEPKDETTKAEEIEEEEEDTTLLYPHRPAAYLPSALLLASRDIYHEASALPFETNEFTFINWFSSGLSGAKAFIGRLAPWQRAAIRYVRVEVPVADLELDSIVGFCGVWNKRGLQQWVELCAMLSGLRGLRLKTCEKVAGFGTGAREMKASEPTKDGWVGVLARMERLRRVEVELDIEGWGERMKVEWCVRVEELVNSVREEEGMMGQVEVVCVERVQK